MLTAEQRNDLRALMEKEIRELEESIQSHEDSNQIDEPDMSVGRISRMDSLVNKGTAELAIAEAQKKLRRLHEKIRRIDEPDFGKCAQCGEWIPLERLRAAPDRGVCLECLRKAK